MLKFPGYLSYSANGVSSTPGTGVPTATSTPSSSSSSSSQKKTREKLTEPESPTTTVISRPRPLSLRGRPHAWGILKGRNKSYSLGHSSGGKSAPNVVLAGEMKVGRSLLDVDTEGQKRDSTVPLCRIQSGPNRPSVFELEKEFLS